MDIPILRFEGCDSARMLTNVYAENVHDLLSKVDDGTGEYEKGFFHTSTIQHEGNCYHKRIWTRDAGRGLIELARLGFLEEANSVAEHLLSHINLQGHWGRTTQFDDHRGFEVDGNALVLLGLYNTWKRCGKEAATADRYLDKLIPVIRWAGGLMETCRHGYLLPCQTELAGNSNAPYNVIGIYPNYAMRIALVGLGEMADAAGYTELSAELAQMQARLAAAIRKELVAGEKRTGTTSGCWINGLDDRDGRVYDFSEWDGTSWPVYHWTRQVPFILQSDMGSLSICNDENQPIHKKSYEYLHHEMSTSHFFRKYGFVSNTAWTGTGGRHDDTMCGYGQGFMTQASLICDDINTYSRLLDGISRLAYDGDIVEPLSFEMNPWLMHECFCYENYEDGRDHTFGTLSEGRYGLMNCPGDEGNLVQEAEIIKVFSLLAGIDDCDPNRLVIMPRIPWTWSKIAVENFVFNGEEGKLGKLDYQMTHDRSHRTCKFTLKSTLPIKHLDVRVGPFPVYLNSLSGDIHKQYEVEQGKNGTWIWLRGLSGTCVEQEICLW